MKRELFILIIFVFAVCFTSTFSYAEGNLNFLYGTKNLEESDWEPLEKQTEFGINLDFGKATMPIHLDIAYFSSSDDQEFTEYILGYSVTYELEASTRELRLGAKYIWDVAQTMHPYVAGGLSSVNAKLKMSAYGYSESVDETGLGYYVAGGLYWTLAGSFNVGAELAYSKATVELYGIDTKAGGTNVLALIGYHF